MDWDDARFFLAVLRSGSLSAASRRLHCSHSTVRRRLAGLERSLGVQLFVASSEGLMPTDVAREAVGRAEAMELAATELARQISGHSESLSGTIRVTTIDVLAEWAAPAVGMFCRKHPDVNVELVTSNRYLDLARREADVAIRASGHPSEVLFGRKVGRFDFAPFASRSLVERAGRRLEDLPWALFVAESGAVLTENWYESWAKRPPRVRVTDAAPLLALVRAGVAAALLPVSMSRDNQLVQLGPIIEGLGVPIWCLTHSDLRASARIRAFMDAIAEHAGSATAKRGQGRDRR